MFKSLSIAAGVAAVLLIAGATIADAGQRYGFGQPATQTQIAGWNIDVNGLTGAGLPPGHGSVAQGQQIFEARCAVCHGDFGEGAGRYPVLAGGQGTLTAERPLKTVGSYWPYAPTLYDYVRRAMPFPAPQSLTNDQVYAVVAYILNLNNIVPSSAVLDAKSLAAIKMPNRDGFEASTWKHDTRPVLHTVACMKNCKPTPVRVISDLVSLHVTPDETERGDAGSTVEMAAAPKAAAAVPAPPFSKVQHVIAQRCAVCHAQKPTQPGIASAPLGIMLDTPARIKAAAGMIESQAVKSHAMPLGNATHMTAQERALVGAWIEAGAKTR